MDGMFGNFDLNKLAESATQARPGMGARAAREGEGKGVVAPPLKLGAVMNNTHTLRGVTMSVASAPIDVTFVLPRGVMDGRRIRLSRGRARSMHLLQQPWRPPWAC